MNRRRLLALLLLVGTTPAVQAQEMKMGGTDSKLSQSLLVTALAREMSGTAWQPMGINAQVQADSHSLEGEAFFFYDQQSGRGSSHEAGSLNWMMGTASRSFADGLMRLRGMLSAEPFTLAGKGYPLLLQTGEVYQSEPIHDRQHPHDLFMELSATYEHALTNSVGLSLYLAPVGEPASGPASYSHRTSAADNPFAPIGHHWQDATHISFGVATLGLFSRRVNLEGSLFNGAEPDQIRTNFDFSGHRMNSVAGRLTVAPGDRWIFLASYALVKDPEPVFGQDSLGKLVRVRRTLLDDVTGLVPSDHLIVPLGKMNIPKTDLHRVVISTSYAGNIGYQKTLGFTATFSRQRHDYDRQSSMSFLLEDNLKTSAGSVFSRVEAVQKTIGDLALPPPRFAAELIRLGASPLDFASIRYNVGEATFGIEKSIARMSHFHIAVGALGTVDEVPSDLEGTYGSRHPLGAAMYVHVGGHAGSNGTMAMM